MKQRASDDHVRPLKRGKEEMGCRCAFKMGLCTQDESGAAQLYSFGGTRQHWEGWFDLPEADKIKKRLQILAEVKKKKEEGGRTAVLTGSAELGSTASIISRADSTKSRYAAMYSQFRTLKKLPPPLSDGEVHQWFAGVQSDLAKFKHSGVRSKELKKLGIFGQSDFKDFNRMFKESNGFENAPKTDNAVVKAEHKRKQLNARMKFVESTILPSQMKRKVFDTATELEILMTVLYYDLRSKTERKTKGHDDKSDYTWLLLKTSKSRRI